LSAVWAKEMPKQTGTTADRHHGQAALLVGVRLVIGLHGGAADLYAGFLLQSFPAAGGVHLGQYHAVGEFVAVAQQVAALELFGLHAQHAGRAGDGRLYGEGALRHAETAEGVVGGDIGAATQAGDAAVGDAVGAADVQERAPQHRGGDVGAGAGMLVQRNVIGEDIALGIEAELIVVLVGVALAGGGYVLVALQQELYRALQEEGRHGWGHYPDRGGLFAAEAAAQAADVELHLVHGYAQHFGQVVVEGARRLGAGVNLYGVMLAGHGQGALSFEIEMLLRPAGQPSFENMFAFSEGGVRVAMHLHALLAVQLAGRGGRARVQHGLQFLYIGFDEGQGLLGVAAGIRYHQRYGLADVFHGVHGQQRLVFENMAHLVQSGHVFMCINRGHTGRRDSLGNVQRAYAALGHRRGEKHRVQAAGHRNIVHELRRAAHVHQRIVVPHAASTGASALPWASISWPSSSRLYSAEPRMSSMGAAAARAAFDRSLKKAASGLRPLSLSRPGSSMGTGPTPPAETRRSFTAPSGPAVRSRAELTAAMSSVVLLETFSK